jgi:rhamnulokinase
MRALAFDFGATSGRAILGALDNGKLTLEELHRFPNEPVPLPTGLYWDTLRLFQEILRGLTIAGRERNLQIDTIGIDTWGVDFAFLGEDGALVDNPRHYRDARTNGVMERAFAVVPREEIFEATGLQFMQLNTLFQWYAMKEGRSPALAAARRLLFMPDLFNYWLTGVQRNELTIASTSQFYDPRRRKWSIELLSKLGLDSSVLGEIVPPGTKLGELRPELGEASGLGAVAVYATGCHDTASAVAAVPAEGDDWCYISSGTWSLMGLELTEPIVNQQSLALNFTNEVGVGGRIRFLKNIAGLWLLEECRREWALEGRDYGYTELMQMAESAASTGSVIDPDAFLEPGHMPARIADYCRSHALAPPSGPAQTCRLILESLAARYRQVLESLETLSGRKIRIIHIVGGGSQNRLLNRLVAERTGRTVLAGPSEATAAGNILTQAIGAGEISGLEEARTVVRRSFTVERFAVRT